LGCETFAEFDQKFIGRCLVHKVFTFVIS
jgi:hypothetical protein